MSVTRPVVGVRPPATAPSTIRLRRHFGVSVDFAWCV